MTLSGSAWAFVRWRCKELHSRELLAIVVGTVGFLPLMVMATFDGEIRLAFSVLGLILISIGLFLAPYMHYLWSRRRGTHASRMTPWRAH